MTLAHYQTQFEQLLDRDDAHDLIHQIRKKAFSKFLETGADGKPSLSAFHRHRFRENWSSLRKVTGVIKVWFDT